MGEPMPAAIAAHDDPASLARQLHLVQNRAARLLAAQSFTIEKLNTELGCLRRELTARDAALAAAREQLATLARN